MGGAFLSGYSAFLKEWYDDDLGIVKQINEECDVITLFKKGVAEWAGKRAIIAVQLTRSDGVGAVKSSGKLPKAGTITGDDYILTCATLAARGLIDRKLMKAAPSKGRGAFLDAAKVQIEAMQETASNTADIWAVSGGPVKGYINEHKADNVTVGAFVPGGASNAGADVVWEYAGSFEPFKARGAANNNDPSSDDYKGVTAATTDTWIRVKLVQQDTYAEILPAGGGGVNMGIFVKAFSEVNGTVTMVTVSDAAGTSTTTAGVGAGFGIALELHQTQLTDAGLNKFGGISTGCMDEANGIFTNLSKATHYGIDRTTATGANGATQLQSTVFTVATAGGHARANIAPLRVVAMRARARNRLGKKVVKMDYQFCNEEQIANYMGVLTAVTQYINNNGNSKADALPDVDNATLNGKMLRTSQHVPKGLMLFLSMNTWKTYEYAPGSMIDEDGSIFCRVQDFNQLEMAWTWDYNILCHTPGANAVLCGISF